MTYSKEGNNYGSLFQGALFSVPVFDDCSVKYQIPFPAHRFWAICCLSKVLKKKREEQEKAEETLRCVDVSAKSLDSKGIASFVALDICKGVVVSSRV